MVEAEAEAVIFQMGQLEMEAEAVQKSTASASLVDIYKYTSKGAYSIWTMNRVCLISEDKEN